MLRSSGPQSGDVVFTYGNGKAAFASGLLQRWIYAGGTLTRPWLSHVAIALNNYLALEASPHVSSCWSGVELPTGVRLILLPDLLAGASDLCVLRNPDSAGIAEEHFEVQSPHVAALYGSSYSIFSLKEEAEQVAPRLEGIIPDWPFRQATKPDDIARLLLDNSEFTKTLVQNFPDRGLPSCSNFFCSQLVLVMLVHLKLLDLKTPPSNITPCGLYDLLSSHSWQDVTSDYEAPAGEKWAGVSRAEWEIRYLQHVGEVKWARQTNAQGAALDLALKRLREINNHLDELGDKLSRK